MINIDNKFDFGQIVYIITDKEQLPRMITAITLTKKDIIYECFAGTIQSKHYDYELSETINELIILQ